MDQGQERPLLVETWLGNSIFVEHIGGQQLEGELRRGIAAEESTARNLPRVKTSFLILENYNQYGIEVRFRGEAEPHFLPWGAILRMTGAEGGGLEESEEFPRERAGQAEEDTPPRDRQELMDQIADARTPTEVASARDAADSWLAANPDDGDVRLVREQLGKSPEEDLEEDLELEEGSPT